MGRNNIEVMKNVVFLGSEGASGNDISLDIKRRIVLANQLFQNVVLRINAPYGVYKNTGKYLETEK